MSYSRWLGYELEPAGERLAEAQRFAKRFGEHPLNVGAIAFLILIPIVG